MEYMNNNNKFKKNKEPKVPEEVYILCIGKVMQSKKYQWMRDFSEKPDSLIRVLMEYKPLDKYIDVKEQELSTPARTGFVVVEWGCAEI